MFRVWVIPLFVRLHVHVYDVVFNFPFEDMLCVWMVFFLLIESGPFFLFVNAIFVLQKCSSNEGSEFLVIFIENVRSGNPLYLYMTPSFTDQVTVSVTTPAWNSTDAVNKTVILVSNNVTAVDLPESLRISGTVTDTKVVHIVADNNIVLYASNHQANSGDSYLVYPVSALGTEYVVATYEGDPSSSYLPVFGVAAVHDDTEVQIGLKDNSTITLDGHDYFGTVRTNLKKYEVLQIVHQNISGANINSNKNIVVNSGHMFLNVRLSIGTASSDHLDEQLLPTDTWPREYVVVSSHVMNNVNDLVRLYSVHADTVITIDNGSVSELHTLEAGESYDLFTDDYAMLIKGNKPFQIAQIGLSTANSPNGDPFLAIPPGTSQYHKQFTFLTPIIPGFFNYINLFANVKAKDHIEFDGAVITPVWSQVGTSDYFYTQITISDGYHSVMTTAIDGLIGGMLFGTMDKDQYGTSIAKYLTKGDQNYQVRNWY